MDKLTFAERRFQQIMPKTQPVPDAVTLRNLRVWLTADVAPAVEQLTRRPLFREYATWPVRALRPEAKTPERQSIDRLEQALVAAARSYVKLLANRRILEQVRLSFPPRPRIVEEDVEVGGSGPTRTLSRRLGLIDDTLLELSQIRALCDQARPPTSLVNIEDYFEPQQEFVVGEDGRRIQVGSHIVAFTPELHPVGNLILQSAQRRLEIELELLTTVRRKVGYAIRKIGRTYQGWKNAEAAWKGFQTELQGFRRLFLSGTDAPLRNACMALTQVYAAFHPAPDLSWLDLSSHLGDEGRMILSHRIGNFRGGEMFERIAAAIGDVRHLYVEQEPDLSAREAAVARGDLVFVRRAKVLYFDGKPMSFDTTTQRLAWELLEKLVSKAQHGGSVGEQDLSDDEVRTRSYMAMRLQRLNSQLPAALRKLIRPGPEPRTYQLKLERQRIYVE